MLKYALKRIVLIFFTLFIILSITYILMMKLPRYKPIDPNMDEETWYNIEAKNGYYEKVNVYNEAGEIVYEEDGVTPQHTWRKTPILKQYGIWLKNVITKWDWGVSISYRRGVSSWDIMKSRFVVNIRINIWATLISVPLGILIGCIIALRKNKPSDQIVMVGSLIFSSIPSFVIITFMMLGAKYVGLPTVFSAGDNLHWSLGIFPSDSVTWKNILIPVTALAIGPIGGYTRLVRNELSEVMTADFVLLARTKGLTTAQTISRHAFRNAMVIYIPAIFGEIIGLLSGSIVLERIYSIPGIGPLFLDAITTKDYNLIMVIMAFEVMIGLCFGLFADLMYGVIDPRIRVGSR